MTVAKQERHAAYGGSGIERATADMIFDRLTILAAGQTAMKSALGLMLDTLHAQTNLLRKLSEYASETPAPSPVANVLGELTSAIKGMDASIGSLENGFGVLSDVIADAFEIKVERTAPAKPYGGED